MQTAHLGKLLETTANGRRLVFFCDFYRVFQGTQKIDAEVINLVNVGKNIVYGFSVVFLYDRNLQ